jgi:hypothetical protein
MSGPQTDDGIDFDAYKQPDAEAPVPEKKRKGLGYDARQLGAGALDMLNLPALYAAPGSIANHVFGKDWDYLGYKAAEELGADVNNSINNVMGVRDPEGIEENVARLGSAFLPAKWASVATKVPKLAEEAGLLTKIAHKTATGAAKTFDAVANPGVQGEYKAGKVAANFGIPFAAGQGVTELTEDPNKPENTVYDHLPGTKATVSAPATDGIDFSAYKPADSGIDFDHYELQADDAKDKEMSWEKKALIATASAFAAYKGARHLKMKTEEAIAKRAAPPSLSDPRPSENVTTPGELTKGALFDEMIPAASQLEKNSGKDAAETFRAQATLGNQVGVNTQAAETFANGTYPVHIDMGEQTPIKAQPLKDLLAVADQLDPVRRSAIDDTLMAMDELDQMRLSGAGPTDKSLLQGKTVKELEDLVRFHSNDPQVKQLVQAFQEQPRANLRYMKQSGLISADTMRKWQQDHPNQMPRSQFEQTRIVDMLLAPKEQGDALDYLSNFGQRSTELEGRGTDFKGTFLPPTTVLANEQRRAIRAANVNNTRRLFFENMRGEDGSFKKGTGLYEVGPESAGKKDVIKYFVNGTPRFVKVADPTIRGIMKNAGQARKLDPVLNVMNTMRQLKQYAITGPITNPVFQVMSGQVWDPIWAAIVKPKNMTMGGATAPAVSAIGAIKGFRASHQARMAEIYRQEALMREMGVDRTKPVSSPLGFIFQKQLDSLPPDRLQQLADSYADAYSNSPVALYRMMGGSGAHVFNDYEQLANLNFSDPKNLRKWSEAIQTATNGKYKPDMYGSRNLSNTKGWLPYYYHSIVDALHNGTRYQMVDLNKPKGNMLKDATVTEAYIHDLAQVARNSRELLDSSKHGFTSGKAGGLVTAGTASLPYANVMLQGFHRLGRAFKENPKQAGAAIASIGLAGASAAWLNSSWSDAQRDWYWNTLTPEQRAGKLWIPNPESDDPAESYSIPLEPTTAAFYLLGQNLFDASFGISSGQPDMAITKNLHNYFGTEDDSGMTTFDRRMMDAGAGGNRLLSLGRPPAADALVGMAGGKFDMENNIVNINGQDVQGYNSMYGNVPTRYVDGAVSAQTEAIMNGLFGNAFVSQAVDMLEGAKMHLDQKPWDLLGAMGEVKDQYMSHTFGDGKVPVKPYTIEARQLKEYEKAIDDINVKATDVARGGYTAQQHGIPLPGRIAPGFDDPMQQQIFQEVKPKLDKLKQIFRDKPGGLSDLNKEKQSILSDPRRTLAERKAAENEINARIQQMQTDYLRSIQLVESQVGEAIGQPDFDLRDWAANKFRSQP